MPVPEHCAHHADGQEADESDDDFDKRLAAIRKNKMAPGNRKANTPYQQLQENKKARRQWHSAVFALHGVKYLY